MSGKSDFLLGLRMGVPVLIASAPFGALFGALAMENGFTVGEAVLMSATIYAGASQMVGLDLFGQHLPAWLIMLSIFAVNFRHVLYSASLGRHLPRWSEWTKAWTFFFLVDPQYAESERRIEQDKPVTLAWYMGMAIPVYSSWVLITLLGALFGKSVGDLHAIGLDFALPIYFLGLVMGFRGRSRWAPVVAVSAVASIIAMRYVGSPWHVSIGALAGVLFAAALPTGKREGADL